MNKGEVPLKLGYVGIRNRSQADINQNKTVRMILFVGKRLPWRRENVLLKKSRLFITSSKCFGNVIFGLKNDQSIGKLYRKLPTDFIRQN